MHIFSTIFLSLLAFIYTPREMLVDAFLDAADARVAVERTILTIYQDAGETITDAELAEYVDYLPMSISRASLAYFLQDLDDDIAELGILVFDDPEFIELLQARAKLLNNYLSIVGEHVRTEIAEKQQGY